jgi:phosphoribosylformimino-5-aminoimidazole carboxamide ribotide isomerase
MIEIIPAIDIIEGKCVRLSQGDYQQKKVYNEDPLEVALEFEGNGIKRLHLVDLEGAKAQHVVNLRVLEKIAAKTSLIIDFGGGIKTNADIDSVFNAGAQQATAGSIAVKDPETVMGWMEKYGANRIILGADVKDKMVAITGWQDVTSMPLFDLLDSYTAKGTQYVICTDIAKDGMLQGSSIDLYKEIMEKYPEMKLVASGGVTDIGEIEKLATHGVYGAIIGKAIYEGKILLKDLRVFIES